MTLEVHQLDERDVYKDMVRVPQIHRGGALEGHIYCLTVSGKRKLAAMRGKQDCSEPFIFMDDKTRIDLGVTLLARYDFTFKKVGPWGRMLWALRAADPGYRISALLGALSFALGCASIGLGLVSIGCAPAGIAIGVASLVGFIVLLFVS